MSFASDVNIDGSNAATIVAIASLQDISKSVVGVSAANDADLWNAGLPIVFVVNQSGEAIFHPDPSFTAVRRPMGDLKIVQEWLESGVQVQSALVPFTADFNGKSHDMIGAYSTVQMADGYNVGVITMQDESTPSRPSARCERRPGSSAWHLPYSLSSSVSSEPST